MKRNPILVLGLGVLLSFGVFAVGCGDDTPAKKNDAAGLDGGKKDSGPDVITPLDVAKGTGGAPGTGGVIPNDGGGLGTGGAIGTGGTPGLDGGAGGTPGTGGTPGLDGGKLDTSNDLPKTDGGLDSKPDGQIDVPIGPDGSPLDTVHPIDATPVDISLDTAIDQGVDAPPAVDLAALDGEDIDTSGVDGSTD